jgi:hypothetical protein
VAVKILFDRYDLAQRRQLEDPQQLRPPVARVQPVLEPAPKAGPGKGDFETFFTEHSPLSQRDELTRKLALTPKQLDAAKDAAAEAYDLSKQIFRIYVPETAPADAPLGVIYYVGYKPTDAYPPQWKQTLDEKRLIFISPRTLPHPDWQQAAVALDAIHNLKKQYVIDEKRVYLFDYPDLPGSIGLQMSFSLADVFSGFAHLNRLQHYRPVPVPSLRSAYPPVLLMPPAALLSVSKTRPHAFVLEDDFFIQPNAPDRRPLFQAAYRRDGFTRLLFIDIHDREELHFPNFHGPWLRQVLEFFEPASTSQPQPGA